MIRVTLAEPLAHELPAQCSVPFPQGACIDASRIRVAHDTGEPCDTQARALLAWPDGSVKWALVLFRPAAAGTAFDLTLADSPAESTPLVERLDDRLVVDTGRVRFSVPLDQHPDVTQRTEGVLTDLQALDGDTPVALTRPRLDAGLVVTEADGRVYSNQKSGPGFIPSRSANMEDAGVTVIEDGPLRCQVRVGAKLCHDNYRVSLDGIFVIEAYRDSGLVSLTVTWRHGRDGNERWARKPDSEARFVRDMRLRLPLAFTPARLVAGIERGEVAQDLLDTSRYALLQDDVDRFQMRRHDWDGDVIPVAHGSADGETAPGWLQVFGAEGQQLNVFVPQFTLEWPNELRVTPDSLEFGLWPEDANAHVATKNILPPHPAAEPERRHTHDSYECLLTPPYVAFFNEEHACLETVRGMQKTQVLVLDTSAVDAAAWAKRTAAGHVRPPYANVDAGAIDAAGVLGPVNAAAPADDVPAEEALANAAAWIPRHHAHFNIHGKFDLGDLYYLLPSPYATGYRHVSLKVHPRLGYWNNNEEDPIHGLFLHGLRTGDASQFGVAAMMGRHLWDVDVRHYPFWGMHTHSPGHCFRSLTSRATDHFWITSLIDYYLVSGDPDVLVGIKGLAAYAREHLRELQFANTNLREVSIAIMQCVSYYHVLYDDALLDSAEGMARQLIDEQHADGYYPRCGHNVAPTDGGPRPDWPSTLFGTLALEAMATLDEVRPHADWRESAMRQIDWFLDKGLLPARDGLNHRCRPDGKRPEAGQGYDAGWQGYTLADMQLLRSMGYAITWALDARDTDRVRRYAETGDRILARLIEAQQGPEYGPAFEGDWGMGGSVADPEPGETPERSLPREPIDPARNPSQIRPLCVSAALRCLPYYLAARGRID